MNQVERHPPTAVLSCHTYLITLNLQCSLPYSPPPPQSCGHVCSKQIKAARQLSPEFESKSMSMVFTYILVMCV